MRDLLGFARTGLDAIPQRPLDKPSTNPHNDGIRSASIRRCSERGGSVAPRKGPSTARRRSPAPVIEEGGLTPGRIMSSRIIENSVERPVVEDRMTFLFP